MLACWLHLTCITLFPIVIISDVLFILVRMIRYFRVGWTFKYSLSNASAWICIRINQLIYYFWKVLDPWVRNFILLVFFWVLLLIFTVVCLFFETCRNLNAFKKANWKPDILCPSVFLKWKSEISFIFILPSNNRISLPLKVCLAGN